MRIVVILLLKVLTVIVAVQGLFPYYMEYVDVNIFQNCDDYPDNSIDKVFDMSGLNIRQSEDGDLIVKGAFTVLQDIPDGTSASVESFKKERGTWQPTIYTSKRKDLCTSTFDSSEVWYPYWENSPQEQLKCPYYKGQRIEIDVSAGSSLNLPVRGAEGEYLARLEFGEKSTDTFVCAIILVNVHKA